MINYQAYYNEGPQIYFMNEHPVRIFCKDFGILKLCPFIVHRAVRNHFEYFYLKLNMNSKCGSKNNYKATHEFLDKNGKNIIEAYQDSYTRAAGNHPSTKSKWHKIGNNSKPISSILIKSSPQGNSQIIPLLLY